MRGGNLMPTWRVVMISNLIERVGEEFISVLRIVVVDLVR